MNLLQQVDTVQEAAVGPRLSIVVPIFNEVDSIAHLLEQIAAVADTITGGHEIICVDDGSTDGSLAVLRAAARDHPNLRIVSLRRNFGQTAAMMAGFDHAKGEVIVTLDADLQNDPKDIPMLLEKLDSGYDVVSGWRKNRNDAPLKRVFVSTVANRLISRLTGVQLNDYGCTLKAYRRSIMHNVRLYGEMHRFIPIYASWAGARVTEAEVQHHSRRFGRSKYGMNRIVKVLLDLLVVLFMQRYMVKPIYVFGGFGILAAGIGMLLLIAMVVAKLVYGVSMISTPLPLLSAMFVLVGMVSTLMGLLAEILMRIYFESQTRLSYIVDETVSSKGEKR